MSAKGTVRVIVLVVPHIELIVLKTSRRARLQADLFCFNSSSSYPTSCNWLRSPLRLEGYIRAILQVH